MNPYKTNLELSLTQLVFSSVINIRFLRRTITYTILCKAFKYNVCVSGYSTLPQKGSEPTVFFVLSELLFLDVRAKKCFLQGKKKIPIICSHFFQIFFKLLTKTHFFVLGLGLGTAWCRYMMN